MVRCRQIQNTAQIRSVNKFKLWWTGPYKKNVSQLKYSNTHVCFVSSVILFVLFYEIGDSGGIFVNMLQLNELHRLGKLDAPLASPSPSWPLIAWVCLDDAVVRQRVFLGQLFDLLFI